MRAEPFSMSLLIEGPCSRMIPVMNASIAIAPPVPSFKTSKMSGSSSMSISIAFIIRTKLTFSRMSKNSASDTIPLPSVSISWKALKRAVTFFHRAISFLRSRASLSVDLKTRWMTTAVITFVSRIPAMPMKGKKIPAARGISSVIGRTIWAQSSNVMIWKRVNMVVAWFAKSSWTCGFCSKVSDFARVSITATAKPQWTKPRMIMAQNISLRHPVMP
mmetsp:Transcript_13416/g.39988  ORF Transcript_13416/g.39988 Transcript_13416/m.39988 type:complete len:218 (-) Transcript_13416:560-1213(-)